MALQSKGTRSWAASSGVKVGAMAVLMRSMVVLLSRSAEISQQTLPGRAYLKYPCAGGGSSVEAKVALW
jgi:hypothetical protein